MIISQSLTADNIKRRFMFWSGVFQSLLANTDRDGAFVWSVQRTAVGFVLQMEGNDSIPAVGAGAYTADESVRNVGMLAYFPATAESEFVAPGRREKSTLCRK